ncbi:hypothetical protein [Gottfriedia solisilvae]|uniref:Lipoprotein n=1 Tax=Gottfriedia solisilvae TaxID=1516104 RepID=A0A8J3F0I1_9BACI|nr:hypothetical protein [Gottfriedia solisilvae]GGI17975.1 hypothetical protein GCM10007380_40620 [Gottfriedia solisilvae]
MKIKFMSILILMVFLLTGCTQEIKLNDIEKIKVELVKKEKRPGIIIYTIKLINGSDYVLKQNNVYVSFPIEINQNAHKGNEYKVEVKGNKLDIQPGEEYTMHVIMPLEGIDKSVLALDTPSYELKGYLEKVDNKHLFSVGGALLNK